MAELEGRTLDRYELRRLIGRGGMANVYEGYDPRFQRVVAVKVFKRDDDDMLRRFIREAHVMAGLHQPHLIEVFDTGECLLDGVMRYYIVMPILTGGTLRQRLRRSPLSLPEVCQCLSDIAGALDYIHQQGIIHRDIKASNVLLNDEGRCYLTDFGIARITTDMTQLTSSGNVLGTVDYVAPELFEVHRRADARSDLYSLGVLLYEMVTGRLPFSADNQLALISMHVNKQPPSPKLYVPNIPSQVEYVIKRALEKQPELRYANATALAEAFCQAVKQGTDGGAEFVMPDLEPAAVMEPLSAASQSVASASASVVPAARPSPLATQTEGFVLPPIVSETPPPLKLPIQREPQRPRFQRAFFLTILALAALLVVSIPIGYTILNHPASQPTPTVQSTDTSDTQGATGDATATASAQATAAARVATQATASAQASATAGPIGTATSGQPVYQDALTDANNSATAAAGWDQGGECNFASDGYHITQPARIPYFKGCRETNNAYGDLALSVNVDILSGHSGGVFFRLSSNLIGNYDGYLFEIDNQGHYKISREQGTTINPLKDWSATSALHTGYHVNNLLQLIARGNIFLFYANGQFLVQVQNSYYNQPGDIGFLATSLSGESDAEVVYSNLKVYNL